MAFSIIVLPPMCSFGVLGVGIFATGVKGGGDFGGLAATAIPSSRLFGVFWFLLYLFVLVVCYSHFYHGPVSADLRVINSMFPAD